MGKDEFNEQFNVLRQMIRSGQFEISIAEALLQALKVVSTVTSLEETKIAKADPSTLEPDAEENRGRLETATKALTILKAMHFAMLDLRKYVPAPVDVALRDLELEQRFLDEQDEKGADEDS